MYLRSIFCIVSCVALLCLFGCKSKSDSAKQTASDSNSVRYKINGTLLDASGKRVALRQLILDKKGKTRVIIMDTARADQDGHFLLQGSLKEPLLCEVLTAGSLAGIPIVLNGEITISGTGPDLESITISGKEGADELKTIIAYRRDSEMRVKEIQAEETRLRELIDEDHSQALDSLSKIRYSIAQEYLTAAKSCLLSGNEPMVGFYAAETLNWRLHFDELKAFATKMASSSSYKDSKYTGALQTKVVQWEVKRAEQAANSLVGKKAPDIEMRGPDGKKYKLSNMRGKVVLVDFWASWCMPCRRENPNVVKVWNRYKKQGFEVYSVSLDEDRDKWISAIGKDKLHWKAHACDLTGFRNKAAKDYHVKGIPAGFLIDRDGIVRAERAELRGPNLEQEVLKVLNGM
ncbi:MAG: peroxiredoxin [Limisphaerales bacterium]|jgi:peroxiredoxin